MRNATDLGYTHGEAYMLMGYESDDGAHRLEVWNSRDGVTPFVIGHPDWPDVELRHVRWHEDRFLGPNHEPAQGDWVFTDLSQKEAERAGKRNAAKFWDDPRFPASEHFNGSQEDLAKVLAESYYGDGTNPHLTQVVG